MAASPEPYRSVHTRRGAPSRWARIAWTSSGQHDRQSLRLTGPHDSFHAVQRLFQHVFVKEQHRRQRLILRGRGHLFADGPMRQETVEVILGQFARRRAVVRNSPSGERRSAAQLFMTPRSKKLLALETKNISTRTPGQPASQRHSTSPSCFRALGAGEYRLSPEMPDRSPVTPLCLELPSGMAPFAAFLSRSPPRGPEPRFGTVGRRSVGHGYR